MRQNVAPAQCFPALKRVWGGVTFSEKFRKIQNRSESFGIFIFRAYTQRQKPTITSPMNTTTPRKRKAGSCRFDPYYKAQWYDERQLAWRDIQKQFTTHEEARKAYAKGKTCRVMRVTMEGRMPI